MNVGQEERFETADTLQMIGNQSITVSKEDVFKNNRAFALNQLQTGILMLSKKETEALLKPRVTFNAAYNFGRTDNQAGLILLNQNNGLNAGVSAIYPLYDGGNIKRQVENIKIEIESNKLIIKQLENDLWANVQFAQNSYQNATEVLKGETEIQTLAQQSLEIAMERYKLGRSTILELKQLQKLYEDSLVRTIIARYDAKFAAIELLRLSGQLLR
jgi:outer membrane protein TolC